MSKEDTKKRILEAGFTLLEKRSILQLTTADICEAADVSSRTFYNYYLDKFDMAQHIMKMLTEDYWKACSREQNSYEDHFMYYYELVSQHRCFFLNNFCYSGPNCLYDYMTELAYEEYQDMILRSYPAEVLTSEVKLALRFYLYGSLRLMIDFINGRTPEEDLPYGMDYAAVYTPEILKRFGFGKNPKTDE